MSSYAERVDCRTSVRVAGNANAAEGGGGKEAAAPLEAAAAFSLTAVPVELLVAVVDPREPPINDNERSAVTLLLSLCDWLASTVLTDEDKKRGAVAGAEVVAVADAESVDGGGQKTGTSRVAAVAPFEEAPPPVGAFFLLDPPLPPLPPPLLLMPRIDDDEGGGAAAAPASIPAMLVAEAAAGSFAPPALEAAAADLAFEPLTAVTAGAAFAAAAATAAATVAATAAAGGTSTTLSSAPYEKKWKFWNLRRKASMRERAWSVAAT
jgi:hypothetical protein